MNPGPFTCKANALPLRYIPSLIEQIRILKIPNVIFFQFLYAAFWYYEGLIKFRYSEKATEIGSVFQFFWHYLLSSNHKWKMGQNFVAFSEYLNFTRNFSIEGWFLLFCISAVCAYIGFESFHSISPDSLNKENL